jgi:hypothetical protein
MNTQVALLFCCFIACVHQESHVTSKLLSKSLKRAELRASARRDRDGARRGVECLDKGLRGQDLAVLFGKLVVPSACDSSALWTGTIRGITNTQLTSDIKNAKLYTNTGNEFNTADRVNNCYYFLKTSKLFYQRKRSDFSNALILRSKKSSTSKTSTYTSINVQAEHINRYKFWKENSMSKSNNDPTFETPHDCFFPASFISNDPGQNTIKITVKVNVINNQTYSITAANLCVQAEIIIAVVMKCIGSINPACMQASTMGCLGTPVSNNICRRFCNPAQQYFEGQCYFLQTLQREGKFVWCSVILLVLESNLHEIQF